MQVLRYTVDDQQIHVGKNQAGLLRGEQLPNHQNGMC
jgi:hypothetical protein